MCDNQIQDNQAKPMLTIKLITTISSILNKGRMNTSICTSHIIVWGIEIRSTIFRHKVKVRKCGSWDTMKGQTNYGNGLVLVEKNVSGGEIIQQRMQYVTLIKLPCKGNYNRKGGCIKQGGEDAM